MNLSFLISGYWDKERHALLSVTGSGLPSEELFRFRKRHSVILFLFLSTNHLNVLYLLLGGLTLALNNNRLQIKPHLATPNPACPFPYRYRINM